MKLINLAIAGLLITNIVTGTLLYERSVTLQKWENISDGLNSEYIGEAVEAIRANEKLEKAISQNNRKKEIIATKECQTSLDILKKLKCRRGF